MEHRKHTRTQSLEKNTSSFPMQFTKDLEPLRRHERQITRIARRTRELSSAQGTNTSLDGESLLESTLKASRDVASALAENGTPMDDEELRSGRRASELHLQSDSTHEQTTHDRALASLSRGATCRRRHPRSSSANQAARMLAKSERSRPWQRPWIQRRATSAATRSESEEKRTEAAFALAARVEGCTCAAAIPCTTKMNPSLHEIATILVRAKTEARTPVMLIFLQKIEDGRKDDGDRAIEMTSERLQLEPPAVLPENAEVLHVRESLGLLPATARMQMHNHTAAHPGRRPHEVILFEMCVKSSS